MTFKLIMVLNTFENILNFLNMKSFLRPKDDEHLHQFEKGVSFYYQFFYISMLKSVLCSGGTEI